MRKTLLFIIIAAAFALSAFPQQCYTYLFSSTPFNSTPAGGPVLQTIGSTITPVMVMMPATTCPDTPFINLTHFVYDAGFKAKAFFTGTYSIEMIFKFDELSGYNRIIDFSNSISDYGIYTYDDCLNFYPTGNIGPCPGAFDTVNYKQIVITRDDSSKQMNVYVNGALFTNHKDSTDYYVIGSSPNDSIKFFRDDNDVSGEASSGNVALIRMADYVFSSGYVVTSYNDFCNRITGWAESDITPNIKIFPNPAKDKVVVTSTGCQNSALTLYNMLGAIVYHRMLVGPEDVIDVSGLPKGIYIIRVTGTSQEMQMKLIRE